MKKLLFPVHPTHSYQSKNTHLLAINQILNRYHCPLIIQLDDVISFHCASFNLKRYYHQHEFNAKIEALSEYYRYHEEMPRLFMPDIVSIVREHEDEKRAHQYAMVGKLMRSQEDEENILAGSIASGRRQPFQKIIKNVELSYYNFEKKNIKKKGKLMKNKSQGKFASVKSLQKPKLISSKHLTDQFNIKKSTILNKQSNNARTKRQSSNNSLTSSTKLSRSKSKSNLIPFSSKPKISTLPLKQIVVLSQQTRNNKAGSQIKRGDRSSSKQKLQQKAFFGLKRENGVKGMFHKALQSKKMK